MKITMTVEGLDKVLLQLQGFSARRLNAAMATALTRTAAAIGGEWTGQMKERFDRPTPLTERAVRIGGARADSLEAVVQVKDLISGSRGAPPSEYLAPQEHGGGRGLKRYEIALQRQGAMLSGQRIVPAAYAKLDAYGNVSRGQLVQVLNQLGTQLSPGYQRVISKSAEKRLAAAKRTGREYVAVVVGKGRIKPGIYQRSPDGLKPVFWFVSSVQYRKRLSLMDTAAKSAPALLRSNVDLAIAEHMLRISAKS